MNISTHCCVRKKAETQYGLLVLPPSISGSYCSVRVPKIKKVAKEWFAFRTLGSGIVVRIQGVIPWECLTSNVPHAMEPGFIGPGDLGLGLRSAPEGSGAATSGRPLSI